MNLEAVTIQDCLDMQQRKGVDTILAAGHVLGFEEANGRDKATPKKETFPQE